ncbi:SDR family oxidoreductase [Cyclobacterium jeungdonense]|uniref:SDR family oxidoreductase n=1 Tax=Cyclobacterium jeungdonense TaxID=708087 RepID=A0ABT8CB91_9BACT|nr:SDR family oxidoreductase [Cyclobacterium jeungdonense]MDN3690079.1 SDR family oxidoreductase [Cyclobacterium jeungdonense]
MKNKTCLVTGANTGIGLATAKALCKNGARVIVSSRSKEKAMRTMDAIREELPDADLDYALADLSSQREIRKMAAGLKNSYSKLDVLINNAGGWFSTFALTEDGIERQWAINHLAPFLLTQQLLPLLIQSEDPRIITVSSDSHFHGKIHFDDVNLRQNYHGLRAYAQSKLANVLFTREFERRKTERKLSSYAVQPGLVKTDIGLKHTLSLHGLAWKIRRLTGKSPERGAETSVYLAISKEVGGISGAYWDKCKQKNQSKKANSSEDASRLWELSKEMCGIDTYFDG